MVRSRSGLRLGLFTLLVRLLRSISKSLSLKNNLVLGLRFHVKFSSLVSTMQLSRNITRRPLWWGVEFSRASISTVLLVIKIFNGDAVFTVDLCRSISLDRLVPSFASHFHDSSCARETRYYFPKSTRINVSSLHQILLFFSFLTLLYLFK